MDRLRGTLEGDRGLTLVELIVALFVLGVVMTGLTAGAISIFRATNHVNLHTDDQNQARNAVAVFSRDIRAASPVRPSTEPAFLVARPNEAQFTANLDDSVRPRLVRLYIDEDSRLVEDATPADEDSSPDTGLVWDTENNAVVRYVAAFVVNDEDLPIFTYLDQNGNAISFSNTPCSGPNGDPVPAPCLNDAARRQIANVTLTLTISSDPNDRVQRFTVQQRVRLPNA